MWLSLTSAMFMIFIAIRHLQAFKQLEVELPYGKIRGHVFKTGNGENYYAFQDIPYAAPPIGNNRFKEPMEPENWSHVLNTTKNSKVCMQFGDVPENLEITEDCLYLNVYVPEKRIDFKESLLPVLLWIHGGRFLTESGSIEYYDPKYLMDHEIIVVTINYRLGPFGFLATTDGVIPGNLGLKDQLFAIKWVHKNIHLFEGDQNGITVMGLSAGAMAVAYIQQSPLSKGLVKSYMIESGTSLSPYAFQNQPDYFAIKMGQALDKNFNSKNSSELLELLCRASAQDILNAPVVDDIYKHTLAKNLIWLPSLESLSHKNAIVTAPMLEAISKGDFQKVPILMGTTSEESISLLPSMDELILEARRYDRNTSLLINPKLNISEHNISKAGHEYKNVYTSDSFEKNLNGFIKYLGEELFSTPTIHHAALASRHVPVYFYQFSYKSEVKQQTNIFEGVGHAQQLVYLFGGKGALKETQEHYPEPDQLTMKRVRTMWTNFVKYQNPTPEKVELLENIAWPLVQNGHIQYLDIDAVLSIKEDPKHYKEVKNIFEKYTRPLFFVF